MNMVQQAPSGQRDNSQRNGTDEFAAKVDTLMSELRAESEALQRESTEIELLLRQTHGEVEKLANREMTITNRVRDMELNLDNYSRTDMKTIYNSAHEIQMRLFMMRAQVEQLEAKRNTMKTLQTRINRVLSVLASAPEGFAASSGQGSSKRPAKDPTVTALPELPVLDSETQQVTVRVIEAQEDERLRVSRQIHDGPAQTMTNLVLRAEICERLLDMDPMRAKTELSGLKSAVNNTLQETRRFIFDLRPMILDDLGLEPTLRRYMQQFVEKYKIEGGVTVNGVNGRLPLSLEVGIFRIVQEALANVSQHAHANHVQASIDADGDILTVTVEDDGAGFNVDESKLTASKKTGLPGIRQRAEMFGGRLSVESAPGRGTRIVTTLPVEQML
jgi:two-component system, NarL family, sensor histidine kinase DegS